MENTSVCFVVSLESILSVFKFLPLLFGVGFMPKYFDAIKAPQG